MTSPAATLIRALIVRLDDDDYAAAHHVEWILDDGPEAVAAALEWERTGVVPDPTPTEVQYGALVRLREKVAYYEEYGRPMFFCVRRWTRPKLWDTDWEVGSADAEAAAYRGEPHVAAQGGLSRDFPDGILLLAKQYPRPVLEREDGSVNGTDRLE